MEHRIVINNFGPIKEVDLKIDKYTLFIGPNASGKSTIAKLVYFCRTWLHSIAYSFIHFLIVLDNENQPDESELFEELNKVANDLFHTIWNIEALQDDLEFCYYSLDVKQKLFSIRKSPEDKNEIEVHFSDNYAIQMKTLYQIDIDRIHDKLKATKNKRTLYYLVYAAGEEAGHASAMYILTKGVRFIPAGRQAFAIPKDERPTFSQDYFMRGFYEYTKGLKKGFRKPISHKLLELKTGDSPPKRIECLELVQDLTSKILKGEYVSPRDDERIYIDNNQYVKLYEASSGQQEALWILNSIYASIEQRRECFTIIEEPEAHLYPETQKALTELISLLANQPGNQVMLTTHSPYILSALNNLLYAHKVGKTKPDEMAEVIDPLLWVDIKDVAAYVVEDGKIRNIIDHELGIINAEEIDSASRIIADEFDTILKLED